MRNNPTVVKSILALCPLIVPIHAHAFVITEQLQEYYGYGYPPDNIAEVDFFTFSSTGGGITFDIFAVGYGEGFFDSQVWLFDDDGTLDAADLIAKNDDSTPGPFSGYPPYSGIGSADGSLTPLDSYLSTVVNPGNYVFAVGMWTASTEDVIDGVIGYGSLAGFGGIGGAASELPKSDYFNPLDYQLTVFGTFDNFQLNGQLTDFTSANQLQRQTITVTEPSPFALLAIGLMGVVVAKRKRS